MPEQNICQCIECGAVFDGDQYKTCPRCSSVSYAEHLDIDTVFYANLPDNQFKRETEIRFYTESMAAGKVFEVKQ